MQRLGLINHLETGLAVVCFGLLVASLVTAERFPCSFDLAGLVEHCIVGVRSRVDLSLAGQLGCSVDNCLRPDPDRLKTNFAE